MASSSIMSEQAQVHKHAKEAVGIGNALKKWRKKLHA